MHMMLSKIHSSLRQARGQEQLLLPRDGLPFSILWQTCFRSFNAGSLRLDNMTLPTGRNAVTYLYPTIKLPIGAILHLLPDTAKNKKGGHCSVVLSQDMLCLSTWLALAIHGYAAADQPITNYITRPLQSGGKLFAEQAMTCSNAWARLVKMLQELGIYTRQNVHSTRKGKMIHQQQELHASNTEIAEAAMCNEDNVKYYTDVHRPCKHMRMPDCGYPL